MAPESPAALLVGIAVLVIANKEIGVGNEKGVSLELQVDVPKTTDSLANALEPTPGHH